MVIHSTELITQFSSAGYLYASIQYRLLTNWGTLYIYIRDAILLKQNIFYTTIYKLLSDASTKDFTTQIVPLVLKNMTKTKTNSVALSPRTNYADWATATCRRNLVPTFVDRGVSRGQCSGSTTAKTWQVNLNYATWNIRRRLICWHWSNRQNNLWSRHQKLLESAIRDRRQAPEL
jgi:hypothetical protein